MALSNIFFFLNIKHQDEEILYPFIYIYIFYVLYRKILNAEMKKLLPSVSVHNDVYITFFHLSMRKGVLQRVG